MSRRFLLSLTALCLIMTAPMWGILALRWPISSDLLFYAASARAFSAQFWGGNIYPRWLIDTNAGFGSPVFVFYSPLPFYAMSLFEFLAPLDPHGFGRIILGITLALFVAGITCRRWLARELPADMADKGALLYAGFPYLLLHMYGGFAVAQLWGIALFPFLLESARDVMDKGWRGMPKLALAYALLACSHLPSMLMFAGIPPLYALVLSQPGRRIGAAAMAGVAAALGFALCGLYLFPAMSNMQYIATEHFLDGNLVYANDFLDTWSQLGIVAVLLPLLILYLEVPKGQRRALLTLPVRFWLAVEAFFFFMAMPLSKPIWDAFMPLQHLQFPFRFFLAMLPGTVFIALHLLPHATRSRNLYRHLFLIALACATVYGSQMQFFPGNARIAGILKYNLLARPEYQTRWMEEHHIDFRVNVPQRFADMPPASIVDGRGSVAVTGHDSRNIALHADIESPEATVALRRFYFPGWEAAPGPLVPEEHDALLSLRLQEGKHDIHLRLPWFDGEREGAVASIISLLVLLVFCAFSRLQAMRDGHITKA